MAYLPVTDLPARPNLKFSNLIIHLKEKYDYYSNFTDEETEAGNLCLAQLLLLGCRSQNLKSSSVVLKPTF